MEVLGELGMAEKELMVEHGGTHCGLEVAGLDRSCSSQFLALR